jgi:hypothetical protein
VLAAAAPVGAFEVVEGVDRARWNVFRELVI